MNNREMEESLLAGRDKNHHYFMKFECTISNNTSNLVIGGIDLEVLQKHRDTDTFPW
jgi:hypothetical protein